MLLLVFVVVPLVETLLLAQMGAALGWGHTVALVLATGLGGGWLARRQGVHAWQAWQTAVAHGRVPEEGLLSAALLLVGGALLITPGVLTDFCGLVLLLPAARRQVAAWLRPKLEARFAASMENRSSSSAGGSITGEPSSGSGLSSHFRVIRIASPAKRVHEPLVIDVPYEVESIDPRAGI